MKSVPAPFQQLRVAFSRALLSGVWTLLVLLLLATPLVAYDYSLRVVGPQTATQGYPLYLRIEAEVTEGQRMWVNYDVDTFDFALVGAGVNPGWGNTTWGPAPVNLKLEIPPTAKPGLYSVTITAESAGTIHSVKVPVEVVEPTAIRRVAQGRQSNADIEGWRSRMVEYGQKHCNQGLVARMGSWEGSIWYYDGDRVYQQMAKYLKDDKWLACAGYSRAVYRNYVLKANGKVPGYRVFPHGLFLEGSSNSKRALEALSKNSSYAHSAGAVDAAVARETAYLLSTFILTGDADRKLATSFALGHLDQWVNGKPYQPFMAGLTMAALIEVYELTGDVRIPVAVQKMLDAMWKGAWSSRAAAFNYWSNGSNPVPDLNMLIAPAFAWFYNVSGDALYLERGDQVFNGGVAGAWLEGGKQFSQNYRWSFDYLKWAGLAGSGAYRPPSKPEVASPKPVAKPVKIVAKPVQPVAVTPVKVVTKPVKPATVRLKPALCQRRLPTLTISPAKMTIAKVGRTQVITAEYKVAVSNNDSGACAASALSLALSVVRPSSMELSVSNVALKLEPGKSATTTVVGIAKQQSSGGPQIAATLSGSGLGVVSESR